MIKKLILIGMIMIFSIGLLSSCKEIEETTPVAPPISYGDFYSLQEAYDLGYLTHEDLESIAYYQNSGLEWTYNEGEGTWNSNAITDYEPIAKDPETIDSEKQIKIKQTRAYYLVNEDDIEKATAEDINIEIYYGTYNGCTAIALTDNFHGYLQIDTYSIIADIVFCYGYANSILIWVEK